MKKIILAASILIATITTQAASVIWSISGVTDSPNNAKAAGWVAYFMDGSTYSTFNALSADKVGAYAAENYLYTASTTVARGVATATATSGSYSAGDEVSGYVVIFDNSTATVADNYAVTSLNTAQVPAAGNLSMAFAFSTATSGWQTTAVPEPTSGLLMLLGMAGLALRRRRA